MARPRGDFVHFWGLAGFRDHEVADAKPTAWYVRAMTSAPTRIAAFVVGAVLAFFAIFGAVASLTSAAPASDASVVQYDAP